MGDLHLKLLMLGRKYLSALGRAMKIVATMVNH
jgi:hypothetical protein